MKTILIIFNLMQMPLLSDIYSTYKYSINYEKTQKDEILKNIKKEGFYISPRIIEIHDSENIKVLTQFLEEKDNSPNFQPGLGFHIFGSESVLWIELKKHTNNCTTKSIENDRKRRNNNEYSSQIKNASQNFIKELCELMDDGDYSVQFNLISDFTLEGFERFGELVNKYPNFQNRNIDFHQDKFHLTHLDFDYLYFLILETKNIASESLFIGQSNPTPRNNEYYRNKGASVPHNSPFDNTKILAQIPSETGAGYLIDQNFQKFGRIITHAAEYRVDNFEKKPVRHKIVARIKRL